MISARFVRAHLAVTLVVTCVTAWFSFAYFHIDEYFQVLELVRYKLGQVDAPLPWEQNERLRPWLQPAIYWVVARVVGVVGVRDVFQLSFVFRLVTGLANVGALALFLRTTLPWFTTDDEKRLHVRVATLLGFLPYLFVRTSSESASMAALTAGWAILLAGSAPGSPWSVPAPPRRVMLAGFLLGIAFELRFQTAFFTIGVLAWLVVVARMRGRAIAAIGGGGVAALAVGALADRWGYGGWELPAWGYFRTNVLEGAAGAFGTDPPFAYLWLLPANVFFPVVVALILCVIVAWLRNPKHPLTWATLPFVVVHNLIAHKEERFLFPIAIVSTALVTMAVAPSNPSGRVRRIAAWGWRRSTTAKVLGGWGFAMMALLALTPFGWHHHVRFERWVHEHVGDELHATALPEINLNLPPFRPRVYDVDKADPTEVVRQLETGTARRWLIADRPILRTGTSLDTRAVLVYSEMPGWEDRVRAERTMRLVDAYNAEAAAFPILRPMRFRSLFQLRE